MNKINILIICFTAIILLTSCTGFLYPKIVFDFEELWDAPPSSATKRLELKDKYLQEIMLLFRQPGNKFKTYLDMRIFVQKQYKSLIIKEMRYHWDEGEGLFLKDAKFKLPEYVSETGSKPNHYFGKDGYYWTYQLQPVEIKEGDLFVDFQKVFKDRKPGEIFKASIEIDYSFDDEPVKQLILDYEVTAIKGSYTSPFMGL